MIDIKDAWVDPWGLVRGGLRGVEIAVVGAGVVGVCVGYRLAQAGARVTMIDDPATPAASDASFAWANAYGKFPRAYWQLNVEGMRDYWDLAKECGGGWHHPTGSLRWELPGTEAERELDLAARSSTDWGATIEALHPSYVTRHVEPSLRIAAEVETVHWFRDEAWIDTGVMRAQVIETAARRYGLRHVSDRVVAIEPGERPTLGLAAGALQSYDVVVSATGTAAADLAGLAGGSLPIGSQTSALILTEPVDLDLHSVVATGRTWLRPAPGHRLLIGSSALPAERDDEPRHAATVASVLEDASAVVPALRRAKAERTVIGSQPVPADNFPVIGFDPDLEGLFHVVSRSGVSLGPRLAKLALAAMLGRDESALAAWGPERFRQGRGHYVGPAAEA